MSCTSTSASVFRTCCARRHLLVVTRLHHCHPHAHCLPGTFNKEPSVVTWPRKPSTNTHCCALPIPTFTCQMTFPPMRSPKGCGAMPLCHFNFFPWPSAPFPKTFYSDFSHADNYTACLFRAFSSLKPPHFFFVRPANVVQSFLHLPSYDQFLRHMSVLVCQRFIGFSSQHSLEWLQPRCFFQLLTLVLCCPFLPIHHSGLFQKHLLHILWASLPHVRRHLSFKQQSVPLRPLNASLTLVSMFVLQRFACSQPFPNLPSQTLSAQACFLNFLVIHFHEKRERHRFHLPPQFQPFCGRDAHDLSLLCFHVYLTYPSLFSQLPPLSLSLHSSLSSHLSLSFSVSSCSFFSSDLKWHWHSEQKSQ